MQSWSITAFVKNGDPVFVELPAVHVPCLVQEWILGRAPKGLDYGWVFQPRCGLKGGGDTWCEMERGERGGLVVLIEDGD